MKTKSLFTQPRFTTTGKATLSKTNRGMIKTCLPFLLLLGLGAGCAGGKKIKSQDEAVNKSVSPASVTDMSGRTSNVLSQWVDRTPSMSQSPAFPAAGEDCGLIYDPLQRRLVLFGGKDDQNENRNEVWALDLEKNNWQKLAVEGEVPPGSEDHVVIYDPLGHRLILHGGEKGKSTNKTWGFDLKTSRWRNMTDSTAPVREDHTAIFDGNGKRMVIFGGRDNDFAMFDVWAFDLNPSSPTFEKWQDLTVLENHPPDRCDHVAVYDAKKNRMVVYGGWNMEEKEYLGDTWAFHFAAQADTINYWQQIVTKESHPPKRRHAVSVYDSARNWFIVFGGFGEEGYLNDVWALDLDIDIWLNVTPGPQPRIDHQAVYDPQSRRMIIYGGDSRLPDKLRDVWELQIQPNLPLDLLYRAAGAKHKPTGK